MSLCDRVAHLLEQRRGFWVDGREIATVGGYAAYRTRISDLRKQRGLNIDNRVRTVQTATGKVRVSEYRLAPDDQQGAA